MAGTRSIEVDVEGRRLVLSNLDKVLYPAAGFTKAQVIDYCTRVAPALLPHVRGRALTLKRYPDGVQGEFFFEKACPAHRPSWVRTAPVWSGSGGRTIDYCLADDVPTLVWLANLAALELHPSLALAVDRARPTAMVFDLDPGAPAGVLECGEVALSLREVLALVDLESVVKTSGSKGLQVYVPLNTPTTFVETKAFARALAELLERRAPQRVTATMAKAQRAGRIFIDWGQNDEHKTTVAVYSLRAMERPTVSTPLAWDEVERACAAGDDAALSFEADAVLARVAARGDLFAPAAELAQRLPPLSGVASG